MCERFWFQAALDDYKVCALVGLEYLVEIQEYDKEKEPTYLCMLCDKKGDPRTVIGHMVSYKHLIQVKNAAKDCFFTQS